MAFKDKGQATKYKNDFARSAYDRIGITPSKERGQEIRAAAARAGQSVNAYVLQAVEERMKREEE
ncbi:MAG: hypothetical protein IJE26_04725 [Oscillospiraceae bacterium]|nr:hypothetical protein [Oscillospiraceae bacterium]